MDAVGKGPPSSSELVAEGAGTAAGAVIPTSPTSSAPSSSSKMGVPSSSSPESLKTGVVQGKDSSKETSHVSTT